MAKGDKKDKQSKLVRREVNNCMIFSGEILSSLATELKLSNINAGPSDMLSQVISSMQPAVVMRDVIEPYFSRLTSNLSEFRTRHALQELEIEIDHVVDYDESGLRFRLYAKTDSQALPDRPAMEGQQAKMILESCFGEFHIDVDMSGHEPVFQQKTPLNFVLERGESLSPIVNVIPMALPTSDPAQLYVNVVHNICGVVQEHGDAVAMIRAQLENDNPSVNPAEFRAHVQYRNGPETAKKKKTTRKKK